MSNIITELNTNYHSAPNPNFVLNYLRALFFVENNIRYRKPGYQKKVRKY